ncbi:MAG: hypothetical protein FWC16_01005 [Defluviitaleaceae bacterium]|nr:hypothetical protein [Defluviitaleaceae bacterium]MCL2273483.1 hypothetical protein [Defluviitaleaceae bacterium]
MGILIELQSELQTIIENVGINPKSLLKGMYYVAALVKKARDARGSGEVQGDYAEIIRRLDAAQNELKEKFAQMQSNGKFASDIQVLIPDVVILHLKYPLEKSEPDSKHEDVAQAIDDLFTMEDGLYEGCVILSSETIALNVNCDDEGDGDDLESEVIAPVKILLQKYETAIKTIERL